MTSRVGSRLDITMTSQHPTDKLSRITAHNKTYRTLYHTPCHTTMIFSTLHIQYLVKHHNTMTTHSDYTIAQSPQPSQIMTSFQASTSSPSPVTPRRSPRKHTQSNQDFRKVKLIFQLKIILNYQYS